MNQETTYQEIAQAELARQRDILLGNICFTPAPDQWHDSPNSPDQESAELNQQNERRHTCQ